MARDIHYFAYGTLQRLRGAFYEGVDPSRQPAKLHHRDEFLARLAKRARLPGPHDGSKPPRPPRRRSAAT
jgi:hypothetical protein